MRLFGVESMDNIKCILRVEALVYHSYIIAQSIMRIFWKNVMMIRACVQKNDGDQFSYANVSDLKKKFNGNTYSKMLIK